MNYLTQEEHSFFRNCLSTIYRFPGNVEQLSGTLFEDIFAEMKNGVRQNGGSSNAVDVIDSNGIKYSLKTASLDTSLDLEKAGKAAREAAAPGFLNRHVLHSIPLEYRVDGTKVLGDPLGMRIQAALLPEG